VAGLGILAAWWFYVRNWGLAERMTKGVKWLYDLLFNKYYVDEAYTAGIVKPLRMLGDVLSDTVEIRGIDGAVHGGSRFVILLGKSLCRLQTGLVRNYALAMLLGVVVVLAYFLVRGVMGW
jgi:NADH-quinone oxidoreductase subunit L